MGIHSQVDPTKSQVKMETALRLVLSLVALTNLFQGAFTANDASTNFGGEFAQKNLNLRRQFLEEILAEIEEEELAIQRQQQQQDVEHLNISRSNNSSDSCYSNNSNIFTTSRFLI